MPLTKEQKQKIIKDLKEKIGKQKVMVFVDFKGLKMPDLSDLRKRLEEAEAKFQVIKKTLLKLVLKEKGIKIEEEKLKGEIAVIFGFGDEILPAKRIYQFSRENENLKILGGYLENQFRGAEEIIEIAQLPTKEELLARLVGSISSPISGLANILQGNIRNFIFFLNQLAKIK